MSPLEDNFVESPAWVQSHPQMVLKLVVSHAGNWRVGRTRPFRSLRGRSTPQSVFLFQDQPGVAFTDSQCTINIVVSNTEAAFMPFSNSTVP